MTEILIVDGYNIIHSIPEIEDNLDRDLMSARKALEAALRQYQLRERSIRSICVVYDGKGASGRDVEDAGLIKNIYTSRGTSADEEIVNMLKNSGRPDRTAVLSRDNFVVNHARAMGVDVLSVESFRKKISGKRHLRVVELSEEEKTSINKDLRRMWGIADGK